MNAPWSDPYQSDLQRLQNQVLDLEIAVDAARVDLLTKSDALLMARRRLARWHVTRDQVGR